jgi:hypothetical protein
MTWRRAASFDHSGVHGEPDTEFARDDAPTATGGSEATDACERSINMKRGRFQSRTPDARAVGTLRRRRAFRELGHSGNRSVPGTRALTRASANTSGPDFMPGFFPMKLRDVRIPAPNEETCFFCRTGFEGAKLLERTLFRNTIQPFDLMSRRHPLFVYQSLQTFIRGSNDVPASSRRQSWRSEVTSSSWRPCGSSSQSSSLRSSPSLPS